MSTLSTSRRVLVYLALAVLNACGGGSSAPTAPTITLSASGAAVDTMVGGKAVPLTATASADAGALSWQLAAGSPGSLSASSGSSVNYVPPASAAITTPTPVTVTVSAGSISKSMSLLLYPDPGPAGLSLVAGFPVAYPEIVDGTGTAVRFSSLTALRSDANGRLLMLDQIPVDNPSQAVRFASPAGVVSTLSVSPPYIDQRDEHQPVHVDDIVAAPDGNVYFTYKFRIVKIGSDGSGINFARATATRLAADAASNIYLMEADRIRKMTPDGTVSDFAGLRDNVVHSVDGQGTAARFGAMRDMSIDKQGNLYVIDGTSVRKITPDATVTTLVAAGLREPWSLDVAPNGNLLVLEATADLSIAPISYDNETPATVMALRAVGMDGKISTVKDRLLRVSRVRVDGLGRTLLSDNQHVNILGADGKETKYLGWQDDTAGRLDGPGAVARFIGLQFIAADHAGNLYVTEQPNRLDPLEGPGLHLRRIAPDGTVTTLSTPNAWWGKPGAVGPQISSAGGIAIDAKDNIYISEVRWSNDYGGSIVKIAPDGSFSVFAGKHDSTGQVPRVDGPGDVARFLDIAILGFDSAGNLYVDDGALRRITPDRVVSTISALPAGFSADADGNTYANQSNFFTRISAKGERTILAGDGNPSVKLGVLPGRLISGAFTRTGPASFALVSGPAVIKLVVPH